MKLPNAERAIVDIIKLRDYCLNKRHPRGKHKARLFEIILDLTDDDAEELQNTLLEIVQTHNAIEGKQDQYGKRYIIDFTMSRAARQATIRSSWIIRSNEDFPRLTSCYVLKR
jgi:hypothetical protein